LTKRNRALTSVLAISKMKTKVKEKEKEKKSNNPFEVQEMMN